MRIIPVLLLILLLVVAIASPAAARQTATPVPTLGIITTPTPGIIIVATAQGGGATPIPLQANGCYAPLALAVGSQVILRGGVNVRNLPSLSGVPVNYYPSAVVLHLDSGPICADGYNWWQVSGVGQPGWVVEGKPRAYYLSPYYSPETTNCAAPLDTVQPGGQLQTVTGSRVRQAPQNDASVVTVAQPGMVLSVLDGPRCFEGLNWWKVRAPFGTGSTLVDGWIAEGYPGGYYVAGLSASASAAANPVSDCMTNLRLHVGSRAAVTYTDGAPRRLRAAPGTSAAVLASLIDGIEFEVIDGNFICADGYNWWNVRIIATGQTGWLAEGRPGNYWFDVLVN
jgi:hypothetical protein